MAHEYVGDRGVAYMLSHKDKLTAVILRKDTSISASERRADAGNIHIPLRFYNMREHGGSSSKSNLLADGIGRPHGESEGSEGGNASEQAFETPGMTKGPECLQRTR